MMLWHKSWRELRTRFLLGATFILLGVFNASVAVHDFSRNLERDSGLAVRTVSAATALGFEASEPDYLWWRFFYPMIGLNWIATAVLLAGSGINTQTTYGLQAGAHGSLGFTLSLPVTRARLLTVRAATGALVALALAFVPAAALPIISRFAASLPPADPGLLIISALFLLPAGALLYCLSTLASTFLDERWHVYVVFAVVGVLHLLTRVLDSSLLASGLAFTSGEHYLAGNGIPWVELILCLVTCGGMLWAAKEVVERTEY